MMSVNRMAVAIRPMDSFTGQPVLDGSIYIRMEDGGAGIRKPDGYVVFWDNGLTQRVLVLESPYFAPERMVLDMGEIRKKRMPALFVWMKPGSGYPYSTAVRIKEQTAEPGSIVRVFMEHSEGIIRLAQPYPVDRLEPRVIALKIPPELVAEGRTLRIRRRSNDDQEVFTIWQACNVSAGMYELEQPLKSVYSIYDEAIGLFIEFKTGKDGICRIPMMNEGI